MAKRAFKAAAPVSLVILTFAKGSRPTKRWIGGYTNTLLLRMSRTMADYGLVRPERGERGRITLKVTQMTGPNSIRRLLGRGRWAKFAAPAD